MQDDPSTPSESKQPSLPPQGPDPGAALPGQAPEEGGFLGFVERLGNLLPDPVTLFVIGSVVVMILSAVAVGNDWAVTKMLPEVVTQVDETGVSAPVLDEEGRPTTEWRVQYTQDGEPEQLVGAPSEEGPERVVVAVALEREEQLFIWLLRHGEARRVEGERIAGDSGAR